MHAFYCTVQQRLYNTATEYEEHCSSPRWDERQGNILQDSNTCTTRKAVRNSRPPPTPCCSPDGTPYSVWQRFPLCPIESNVNENFKVIQNPGFLPDHPQNWITCKFAIPNIPSKLQEDPSITFRVILLTHRQTDRQTKSGKNITSLSEVIKIITKTFFLLSLSCLSSL